MVLNCYGTTIQYCHPYMESNSRKQTTTGVEVRGDNNMIDHFVNDNLTRGINVHSFSRLRIGDYLQYYTDPDKDDTCAVFVGQAANASPSNVTAPVVMIDRTIIKTMPKALVLRYDNVNASFQRIDMGRVYMDASGRFTLSTISRPDACSASRCRSTCPTGTS